MEENADDHLAAEERKARERAFAEGDLGTIQSILFGSQAKQLEERMAELERRMHSGSDQVRAQLGSELRASEQRLQGNLDSAMSELRQAAELERAHRLTSFDELGQRHRDSTKEVLEAVALTAGEARSQREILAGMLENAAEHLRNGAGGTPDHH